MGPLTVELVKAIETSLDSNGRLYSKDWSLI
jgi:hypothetical protein